MSYTVDDIMRKFPELSSVTEFITSSYIQDGIDNSDYKTPEEYVRNNLIWEIKDYFTDASCSIYDRFGYSSLQKSLRNLVRVYKLVNNDKIGLSIWYNTHIFEYTTDVIDFLDGSMPYVSKFIMYKKVKDNLLEVDYFGKLHNFNIKELSEDTKSKLWQYITTLNNAKVNFSNPAYFIVDVEIKSVQVGEILKTYLGLDTSFVTKLLLANKEVIKRTSFESIKEFDLEDELRFCVCENLIDTSIISEQNGNISIIVYKDKFCNQFLGKDISFNKFYDCVYTLFNKENMMVDYLFYYIKDRYYFSANMKKINNYAFIALLYVISNKIKFEMYSDYKENAVHIIFKNT